METTGTPIASAQDSRRHRLRALRPLIWWSYLVLFLFLVHTHERLSAKTKLYFAINFKSQELWIGPTVRVDKREVANGERISIGHHALTVEFPKAEPFQTNFFVWYGSNGLGVLDLKRAYGSLDIKAEPKVRTLTISGPEFRQTFSNFSGQTLSLPTDDYAIDAKYANCEEHHQTSVFFNQTTSHRIMPRLGSLALTCNKDEATFELVGGDNRLIEASAFPANIVELPEGHYKVLARRHGFLWEKQGEVSAKGTNSITVELASGRVVFKTQPAGAAVTSQDGRAWGSTPITIEELPAGIWKFAFNANGYEPAIASLEIKADETINFQTNLVSRNYTAAITAAKQYFESGDYERAGHAAADAFLARNDDPIALKIQREAMGFVNLRQAKAFGKQGDFVSGVRELEKATNALPDNVEAAQLLSDFKTRVPAQLEQIRVERLHRGEEVLKWALARQTSDQFFELHELKTEKAVKEVAEAIVTALRNQPPFQITRHNSKIPGTFDIEAVQVFKTSLGGYAGKRVAVVVGAQTTDEETQILFKVLEYKAEAKEKFSIGNWIGSPVDVNYVPIHASGEGSLSEKFQARLSEGVSNVTARIQGAIENAPNSRSAN